MIVRRDRLRPICRYCKSESLVKNGKRYNERTMKQRWMCKSCHRYFVENDGFIGMRHRPETITRALDLYYEGLSFKSIREYLRRHHRVSISRKSLWEWSRKYGRLAYDFMSKLRLDPNGRNLHCDEKWPKVGNKTAYFWFMCFGTPHFIASACLSRKRLKKYPRAMFKDLRYRMTSPSPMTVTDGAGQYNTCEKYFHNRSEHVIAEGFGGWPNQQRIERLNGDFEDWIGRRNFQSMRSARDIFLGWVVHHNFVHEYKDAGKTPAERIGINILNAGNKWMQLIEMAHGTSRGGN